MLFMKCRPNLGHGQAPLELFYILTLATWNSRTITSLAQVKTKYFEAKNSQAITKQTRGTYN